MSPALKSASAVRIREAQFEDHGAITALQASQHLKTKPFDEWKKLWIGNPCYESLGPRWPIGWVLETGDGRIVGALCNVPIAYHFRDQTLLAAAGRGWAVDEQYRAFALLLMDEYFNQPNVDLFINTTVNGSAEQAFSTFGSSRVPVGDWSAAAFFITGFRGFAETALRIKGLPLAPLLSFPAGGALWAHHLFTSKRLSSPKISVIRKHRFDHHFDAFWKSLSKQSSTLLAARDSKSLTWHFSSALDRDEIWILTAASREGDL